MIVRGHLVLSARFGMVPRLVESPLFISFTVGNSVHHNTTYMTLISPVSTTVTAQRWLLTRHEVRGRRGVDARRKGLRHRPMIDAYTTVSRKCGRKWTHRYGVSRVSMTLALTDIILVVRELCVALVFRSTGLPDAPGFLGTPKSQDTLIVSET